MTNYQGSQDCEPIDRSSSESCTLHLEQTTEPISIQKFLDRIMQYQVDPAQIGRQICQIITTSSDGEMLLQIANILGTAYQADYCLVTAVTNNRIAIPNANWGILGDRENSTVVADVTTGLTQTTMPNSLLSAIEHPLLADILADGEMVAIADTQDCETTNAPNSPITSLPFRAILASPVRFGGEINGMIVLGKLEPQEWSVTSCQCLEMVSSAIGSAIFHIQKNQEITKLNQQLQRQVKYKNLLSSVVKELNTNSEIALVLQQVIETTANTLEVDQAQIILLKYTEPFRKTRSLNQIPQAKIALICEYEQQKDQTELVIEQSEVEQNTFTSQSQDKNRNKTTNSKSKFTNSKSNNPPDFWMSQSSLFQSAFNNAPETFTLDDVGESIIKEQQHLVEILKLQDSRALVIVPLVSAREQETVLGFLVLQQSEPRTWQPEELEVLELIATQISTAMLQTQTFNEMQALIEDRTAQLQQSLDIQGELYEQSANQLEQLRKWKQIKDEFLDAVNHELRTPLTIMKLAIVMLKNPEQPATSQTKYLDILEQKCFQEIALIEDLLALKQFQTSQLPICPLQINLKHLIQDLVQDFEQKPEHQKLTLKVKLPKLLPTLESDRDSLKRILLELLTNAGKYSASGTMVVLEVSAGVAGHIVFSVSNCGRSISTADLPHIWENFRRGTGITGEVLPGMGLGLALVKCLVKHLNGSIDVYSCPSESSEGNELCRTSFTLTLPVLNHR
jgi:signal transduction histidine kinase